MRPTRWWHRFLVLVCLPMATTVAAAQVADNAGPRSFLDLAGLLGISGFGMAAGALISWARHARTVETHDDRLRTIEDDRVTREEFKTMQTDIREIRQMLERRSEPRL